MRSGDQAVHHVNLVIWVGVCMCTLDGILIYCHKEQPHGLLAARKTLLYGNFQPLLSFFCLFPFVCCFAMFSRYRLILIYLSAEPLPSSCSLRTSFLLPWRRRPAWKRGSIRVKGVRQNATILGTSHGPRPRRPPAVQSQ